MKKYCYIGIDPAFRKNGFCVYIIDEVGEHRYIVFRDFIEFMAWLTNDSPDNAVCLIENSNLQNVTFDMRGGKQVVAMKSRSVGKNQAVSQVTYELCRWRWGKHAIGISPKRKGAKLNKEQFKKRYKIDVGNQDARDAGMLAHMAKQLKT